MITRTLSDLDRVVAIGGGHGLGRVLSSLAFLGPRLTGIVATTDNGGSTGRLREEHPCIAWGDLRNCITQLVTKPSIGSLLFEYRFNHQGELEGHNLGNLMLLALDNLCVRPLEAINLIRSMLKVDSFILPMAESPTNLGAVTTRGDIIHGEVEIDANRRRLESLFLYPQVDATEEAVAAIECADLILLGPGSFFTSIVPPLLLPGIQAALRHSQAKKIYVANLVPELGPARHLTLETKVHWLNNLLDDHLVKLVIADCLIAGSPPCPTLRTDLRTDEHPNLHDREKLRHAIEQALQI